MINQKIVISVNAAWNMHNFRSGLIKALVRHGYDVVAVAPDDEYAPRLKGLGCRFMHMPMDKNGTHPGHDLSLLMRYARLLYAVRPVAYLGYTVKPNVYGSIAAQALSIPVINNIAGLGATFIHKTYLTSLVKGLYRLALRRSKRVFFQNAEDQNLFVREGLVKAEITDRLPGSGIDLSHYRPAPIAPLNGRPFRFLMIARMLKDKGLEEFVAAAKIVRQRIPGVECLLLGFVEAGNANSVPIERIQSWQKEGWVRYLGRADDVRPYIEYADCVVLPSYREGVPRSLLEAAAMARPLIATDVAGCRDIVDHEINGLLCRAQDGKDLAEKMQQMIAFTPERRADMGMAGRHKVTFQFDERIVIRKYLDTIDAIAASSARPQRSGKLGAVKPLERS